MSMLTQPYQVPRGSDVAAGALNVRIEVDRVLQAGQSLHVRRNGVHVGTATLVSGRIYEFVDGNPDVGLNAYTAYVTEGQYVAPTCAPYEVNRTI